MQLTIKLRLIKSNGIIIHDLSSLVSLIYPLHFYIRARALMLLFLMKRKIATTTTATTPTYDNKKVIEGNA